MKHKLIAALLAAVLTGNCIGMQHGQMIRAEDGEDCLHCTYYNGTNIGRQDYNTEYDLNAAQPTNSALVPLADGSWMKVQADDLEFSGSILIEYYNASFDLVSRKFVELELPLFGCFYQASDGYYYLVTGQDNIDEEDDKPVFDIAKYTTDWKLAGHDQLCGANTAKPFNAGTARCADDGKYLIVRTCHEMFDGSNTQGHQANVTIELDMETMKITDSLYDVSHRSFGYVSHSFNQFVLLDGNKIVSLDHGDYLPRSLVMMSYKSDYTTGSFTEIQPILGDLCDLCELYKIAPLDENIPDVARGSKNYNKYMNYTGVSVGGFVQSSTHYIAAFNSINQDEWRKSADGTCICGCPYLCPDKKFYQDTRNVMIAAVPKDGATEENIVTYQLTDYAVGEESVHCPHITPIGDDRFLLLWQHENTLSYVILDATGAAESEVYTMEGELSDCEPVYSGGKVYWYTWNNEFVTFYSIDVSDPKQTDKTVYMGAHDYTLTDHPDANGKTYETCSKCGKVVEHTVPTFYYPVPTLMSFGATLEGVGSLSSKWASYHGQELHPGSYLTIDPQTVRPTTLSEEDSQFCIEITEGAEYVKETDEFYYNDCTVFKIGDFEGDSLTFTMVIYPKYNPSDLQSFTFTAYHDYIVSDITFPDEEQDGSVTWKCYYSGYIKETPYEPFETLDGSKAVTTLSEDTFEYDHDRHFPDFTFSLKDPQTGEVTELTAMQDYDYSYIRNINAGTGYVVIFPYKNNTNPRFKGIYTIPFTITQQDMYQATLSYIPSSLDPEDPETDLYDYIRPKLELRDKQNYVIADDDYYIKGMFLWDENQLRMEKIDFAIHAKAQNYSGGNGGFYDIPLIDLSNYEASFKNAKLASTGKVDYSGYAVEPLVDVRTSKGRVLQKDVDYLLTYEDNTERGVATVTITGIGYYEGEIKMHFTIGDEIHAAPPTPTVGDLDGDGKLSTEDAKSLTDILTGETEVSEETWKAADFNQDDTVNVIDLTMMKQQIFQQAGK